MHEVIHISASSIANHLQTHFYNAQESYFVYDDDSAKISRVDPHVLFKAGKAFTPRALIWEMRGGYGAMKGFSGLYEEELIDSNWNGKTSSIKADPITKGAYQAALDAGNEPPALSKETTRYWSDYLNMYYHPKSLQTLTNWEYDPIKFPKGVARGGERQFMDFTVGSHQWTELNDEHSKEYLEEVFRPVLEMCDQASGVSITSEVDSAWGGFTAEMLADLRDNHIPKLPVFTWGLHDSSKITRAQQLSRIRTSHLLVENSTLYIPMQPPVLSPTLDRGIDLSSSWHLGAMYNTVYESFSLLSSLRNGKRVTMSDITNDLQRGTNRNIVGQVRGAIADTGIFDFSTAPSTHVFSRVAIKRSARVPVDSKPKSLAELINATVIADPWDSYFPRQSLLGDGTDDHAINTYEVQEPYALPKSHPNFITPNDDVYSSLSVTDSPYHQYKEWAKFVTSINIEEREELKEELSNISEEYSWGYEESDLDDD